MASYKNRESFIPYSRHKLIDLCIQDSNFSVENKQKFREFCQILSAYYHFKFHSLSEQLKEHFSYFDPEDDDTENIESINSVDNINNINDNHNNPKKYSIDPEIIHHNKIELLANFRQLLEKANYDEITPANLASALEEKTLLDLNTIVDFDDYEDMVCYYRGADKYKTIEAKKWFGLKKVTRKIDVFERIVLLIKFKNRDHFDPKELKKFKFQPGKVYIYLFKNIPKFDLDFIFPNVKIRMTLKDRLILIGSAIGAAVPVFIKILPQLLLIIGIIFFVTTGNVPFENVDVNQKDVNDFMPVLLTTFSLIMAFGGFAFKQYTNYKSKHIKFQKEVTETLFFRQLGINLGVFQSLIDEAEEEECKEIILVYYHLLMTEQPVTFEQIDDKIEQWTNQELGFKIDFDIKKTIANLAQIKGKIIKNKASLNNNIAQQETNLVTVTDDGYCHALSIEQAKEVIDYTWDNLFDYANSSDNDFELKI